MNIGNLFVKDLKTLKNTLRPNNKHNFNFWFFGIFNTDPLWYTGSYLINRIPLFHGKKETNYIAYPRNEINQQECKKKMYLFSIVKKKNTGILHQLFSAELAYKTHMSMKVKMSL